MQHSASSNRGAIPAFFHARRLHHASEEAQHGAVGRTLQLCSGRWAERACADVQYPVTATQWHPEKNAFEWPQHLAVPHSSQAVRSLRLSLQTRSPEEPKGDKNGAFIFPGDK